jgi:hypothetical protein
MQAVLMAVRMGKKDEAQGLYDRAVVELEAATDERLAVDTTDVPSGAVEAVAWSGDTIAVAHGRYVSILDAATLRERLRLEGHTDRVTSVAFSPDGKRLALGSVGVGLGWRGATQDMRFVAFSLWKSGWRRARRDGAAVGTGEYSRRCGGTPARSRPSRSRRTGRCWRRARGTRRCGCGTWGRANASRRCRGTTTRSRPSRSRRTGRGWRRARAMRRCGCGRWGRAECLATLQGHTEAGLVRRVLAGREEAGVGLG